MVMVALAFTAISPTMARAKARATTRPVWAREDDFGSFAAKEDDAMAEQTRARSPRIPWGGGSLGEVVACFRCERDLAPPAIGSAPWPWPGSVSASALSRAEFTFTLLTPGSAP